MNDNEFLAAFEAGALPHFPHRAHVWMAWLYLRANGYDEGVTRICSGIRRLAASHGATQKYHATLTVFWARMVYHAIQQSPDAADFEAFIAQHPDLLNTRLTDAYYSKDVLWSAQARAAWVEPDLQPMPQLT